MLNKRVLLTGASGFLGKSVLKALLDVGAFVVAPVRNSLKFSSTNLVMPKLDDISSITSKPEWFCNCDVVIHIAAKAHLSAESKSEYERVNTRATLDLATFASNVGVKRFIFISSIGVNGIYSSKPFTVTDKVAPHDDYAISKFNAEIGLKEISKRSGMELVIIRPPLVYGHHAPGNFGKLIAIAQKNLPLPLGLIDNKRSLVALDNLVDLIITCIQHPKAANNLFLVSDDYDLSTTALLELIIRSAGKTPFLLPVPVSWLRMAGKITGNQSVIDRLCGNLQVDISHTKETLGWKPPISVEEGIRRCFKD